MTCFSLFLFILNLFRRKRVSYTTTTWTVLTFYPLLSSCVVLRLRKGLKCRPGIQFLVENKTWHTFYSCFWMSSMSRMYFFLPEIRLLSVEATQQISCWKQYTQSRVISRSKHTVGSETKRKNGVKVKRQCFLVGRHEMTIRFLKAVWHGSEKKA